jgi:uncharacterized Zn-binding protein involved in type VI secretion
MTQPAARITDMHTCPLATPATPPIPHVGGPIIKGQPNVLIGFMPAARVADMAICVGPPDSIAMGSPTVLIGFMPAARMGDPTVHGGVIVAGHPQTLIGGAAGGGAYSPGSPSAMDRLAVWLWNLTHGPDQQREIYSEGIIIQGDAAFRAQTRAALDRLASVNSGAKLLSQIDASGNTVTIIPETDPNGYCTPDNLADAQTPGKGSDSTVAWNPNHHTTDPADPQGGTPGSTVILGHELVHANHNAHGEHHNGPNDSYGGQRGTSSRGEERATVGAGGTNVTAPDGTSHTVPDHSGDDVTENAIRDDFGIPRRPTYYPSTWPGGAPW